MDWGNWEESGNLEVSRGVGSANSSQRRYRINHSEPIVTVQVQISPEGDSFATIIDFRGHGDWSDSIKLLDEVYERFNNSAADITVRVGEMRSLDELKESL